MRSIRIICRPHSRPACSVEARRTDNQQRTHTTVVTIVPFTSLKGLQLVGLMITFPCLRLAGNVFERSVWVCLSRSPVTLICVGRPLTAVSSPLCGPSDRMHLCPFGILRFALCEAQYRESHMTISSYCDQHSIS